MTIRHGVLAAALYGTIISAGVVQAAPVTVDFDFRSQGALDITTDAAGFLTFNETNAASGLSVTARGYDITSSATGAGSTVSLATRAHVSRRTDPGPGVFDGLGVFNSGDDNTFRVDGAGPNELLSMTFMFGGNPIQVELLQLGLGDPVGMFSYLSDETVRDTGLGPLTIVNFGTPLLASSHGIAVVDETAALHVKTIRVRFDDQPTGPGGNIPEPGTLALLGFGLAGLGVMRRRKRSSA